MSSNSEMHDFQIHVYAKALSINVVELQHVPNIRQSIFHTLYNKNVLLLISERQLEELNARVRRNVTGRPWNKCKKYDTLSYRFICSYGHKYIIIVI